jgi:TonB family protein
MRCIHCGNDVKAVDAACRHCGARIVRPSIEQSSDDRRSAARMASFFLALLVAGAAVWIAGGERQIPWPFASDDDAPAPVSEPAAAPTPPPDQAAPPQAAVPPPPQPAAPEAPPPAATPAMTRTPAPATPASAIPAPRGRADAADRQSQVPSKPDAPTRRRADPATQAATPAAPSASSQPVRVGGNIAPPKKIKDVPPVYPAMAQQARVQGIVIIEATIGTDGTVRNTRVLRSVPLLDPAALEAVSQWEYEPTLLNGVRVPVIMTVTVNFSLK